MRVALLVLAAGCDQGNMAAPSPAAPATSSTARRELTERIDVVIREYGTEMPIVGATIVLARDLDCDVPKGQPCPERRRTATSDAEGLHIKLALSDPAPWRVERISAPGYATECPTDADPFELHDLVREYHDSNDGADHVERYLCHLVPPSAMSVTNTKQAIERARRLPDLQDWLHTHAGARATAIRDGIGWQVRFDTDRGAAQLVLVTALDGSPYVSVGLNEPSLE